MPRNKPRHFFTQSPVCRRKFKKIYNDYLSISMSNKIMMMIAPTDK